MSTSPKPAIALVIEDDVATRSLLMRALRSAGLAPIGFGSAEAAIAWVEMNGAPAFASVDACLPRMSGFELCAWLREHAPGVDIAVVTGRCSLEDEIRALELNAVHVKKPVRIREYLEIVVDLLESGASSLHVTKTAAPQSVHFWSKGSRERTAPEDTPFAARMAPER